MQAFRSSRLFCASAQQVFPLESFPICPCKDIPDPAFYILRFFLAEPDCNVSVFYIQPKNRTCVVLLTAQDKIPLPVCWLLAPYCLYPVQMQHACG